MGNFKIYESALVKHYPGHAKQQLTDQEFSLHILYLWFLITYNSNWHIHKLPSLQTFVPTKQCWTESTSQLSVSLIL